MLKERIQEALIAKARKQSKPKKSTYIDGLKYKLAHAEDDVSKRFYTALLAKGVPKKKKEKTVASVAYQIAKKQGIAPKLAGMIGLAFLGYDRGSLNFQELCERTQLGENEILNNYRDAIL